LNPPSQSPHNGGIAAPSNGAGVAAAPSDEVRRLVAVLNALLRHRALIIGLPVIAGVAALVLGLREPRQYTSSARFVTQGSNSPTPLGGLAAQFGLPTQLAGDRGQSPAFYTELLTSHTILARVAGGQYAVPTDRGLVSGSLAQVLGLSGPDSVGIREAVVGYARGAIGTYVSPATGVVTLSVRSRWPSLAYQLNRGILSELDRFNRETRQSQAAAERRFGEERLRATGDELRAAEGRLQAFLQQNRAWENSPQLKFQQERLARDVRLREQVYGSLAQAVERARIDEVRDTPLMTIIEEPRVPRGPEPRGVPRRVVLAVILGGLLAAFLALAIDFLRWRGASEAEEFVEFEALRQEALRDLRNPLRPFGRILGMRPREHPTELRR
jgi:uncharacterized protein involved in exopolysaccharide biosynthesis